MRIGLHDAEKDHMPRKTFPNYALMKISAYHKAQGDIVEWWSPITSTYDRVYSSKVFDFTEENMFLPKDAIKGGTGYGLYNNLPDEIDKMFPDYSIYPECDYAIGFITRGCPNKCEWCYVPQKEGDIKAYNNWGELVRKDTNKLVLMDNNILASDFGLTELVSLSNTDYKIDLNQGMDVRLINESICKILKNVKWIDRIRFSCDHKSQLPYFEKLFELFNKYKIAKSKVFIYVLVREDLEDADYRIQELNRIYNGFHLYAQAERNDVKGIVPNKTQLEFAQRYVYGRSYRKENWKQYCERKNIEY